MVSTTSSMKPKRAVTGHHQVWYSKFSKNCSYNWEITADWKNNVIYHLSALVNTLSHGYHRPLP